MWTRKFWMDLAERVIASAAGGAVGAILIDGGSVNLKHVAIGAGGAALVSLLKGLVASQKGNPASASLVE